MHLYSFQVEICPRYVNCVEEEMYHSAEMKFCKIDPWPMYREAPGHETKAHCPRLWSEMNKS
jgi:hypothetical protein